MVNTLLDNMDLIIKAGIELLMALVKSIGPTINALVQLVQKNSHQISLRTFHV